MIKDSTEDVVKLTCMGSKEGVTMAMEEIENIINRTEIFSMTIPRKYCAFVIQNLDCIKYRTGISDVQISKANDGNLERKVEIAGTKDQMEKAREAIQNLVKES